MAMMEEQMSAKRQDASWLIDLKDAALTMIAEMLKGQRVSRSLAYLMMILCFMQIFGTILEANSAISWKDDLTASFVQSFFEIMRVVPMMETDRAVALYWFLYAMGKL
jgi:hypothetical protein